MAISYTEVLIQGIGANDDNYVPTNDPVWTGSRLALAVITNNVGSGTAGTPTLQGALSWSVVQTHLYQSTTRRVTLLAALTGSGTTDTGFAVDFGGTAQGHCNIVLVEADGVDLSGTALDAIVQTDAGDSGGVQATQLTATLAAFADPDNRMYVGYAKNSQGAPTADDGNWTKFGDATNNSPASSGTAFAGIAEDNSVTVDNGGNVISGWVAAELKAAGGGGPVTSFVAWIGDDNG